VTHYQTINYIALYVLSHWLSLHADSRRCRRRLGRRTNADCDDSIDTSKLPHHTVTDHADCTVLYTLHAEPDLEDQRGHGKIIIIIEFV